MKICLFLLNRLDFEGGAEKYFVEMAQELRRMGHEVSIVCNSYLYINVRVKIQDFIFKILCSDLSRSNNYTPKHIPRDLTGIKIFDLALNFHFPFSKKRKEIMGILSQTEVIYCKNEFIDATYLHTLIGKKDFKKVVMGVHTSIFIEKSESLYCKIHNILYFSKIYRSNLIDCGSIHVPNSDYTKMIQKTFGVNPEKIFFVPYGLKETDFNIAFKTADNTFTLLFAGRFTEQKGIDYLEEFTKRIFLKKSFRKIKIYIAGAGPMEDVIKRIALRYKNVDYLGFVSDMNGLYRKVDLAIVLSRWEMFPYNCLEPQSKGLPVIAFDIPGIRDIIVNGTTGELIPLADIEKFETAVLLFIELKFKHPASYQRMKRKILELTRKRFLMKNISKSWKSFLSKF